MHFNKKDNSARIKEFIENSLSQGKSGNKIEKELRAAGLGYKREHLLEDIKTIKDNVSSQPKPETFNPLNVVAKNQPKTKKVLGLTDSEAARPQRTSKDKKPQVFKDSESKAATPKKSGSKSSKGSQEKKSKDVKTRAKEAKQDNKQSILKTSKRGQPTQNEINRREQILRDVIKEKGHGSKGIGKEYIDRLKKEGLSYRKTDMEKDVRRGLTILHAKTDESKERADKFFTNVYENVRAMLKREGKPYNRKAVNLFIKEWKQGSKNISRAEDAEVEEYYFSMYS